MQVAGRACSMRRMLLVPAWPAARWAVAAHLWIQLRLACLQLGAPTLRRSAPPRTSCGGECAATQMRGSFEVGQCITLRCPALVALVGCWNGHRMSHPARLARPARQLLLPYLPAHSITASPSLSSSHTRTARRWRPLGDAAADERQAVGTAAAGGRWAVAAAAGGLQRRAAATAARPAGHGCSSAVPVAVQRWRFVGAHVFALGGRGGTRVKQIRQKSRASLDQGLCSEKKKESLLSGLTGTSYIGH